MGQALDSSPVADTVVAKALAVVLVVVLVVVMPPIMLLLQVENLRALFDPCSVAVRLQTTCFSVAMTMGDHRR